jgi:hypothetical protein
MATRLGGGFPLSERQRAERASPASVQLMTGCACAVMLTATPSLGWRGPGAAAWPLRWKSMREGDSTWIPRSGLTHPVSEIEGGKPGIHEISLEKHRNALI